MKSSWMMVLPVAAALVWACGDDTDTKKNDDDDGGSGGMTSSSGSGTGGTSGSVTSSVSSSVVSSSSVTVASTTTGGGPFMCIDTSTIQIAEGMGCNAADQTNCECNGCGTTCEDDGAGSFSDCVCSVCASDTFCSNPDNCNQDGQCDPFNEGCGCIDCADHPLCP